MSIADKLTQIAENQQRVFEAGKQSERDLFWDTYQENGNRKDYGQAFRYVYWTDENFNPKYDIVPNTYGAQMFHQSVITRLASKLKELGVKLDTSKCDSFLQMFQSSSIKDIPELDGSNCNSLSYTFGSGAKVETIEKLILTEKLTNVQNTFSKAYNLTHCIFDGVLAITGLDMKDCRLLDKESIISLVNILSTTTSGLAITLSLQAVNKAFETSENANNGSNSSEWQTLVNTKQNWTINLS